MLYICNFWISNKIALCKLFPQSYQKCFNYVKFRRCIPKQRHRHFSDWRLKREVKLWCDSSSLEADPGDICGASFPSDLPINICHIVIPSLLYNFKSILSSQSSDCIKWLLKAGDCLIQVNSLSKWIFGEQNIDLSWQLAG